jgi:hypothetical protein
MFIRPERPRKYGYNPDPRLSAAQIAEYLTAAAPRRATIIREAKFPKTAVVAKYREARQGITRHLCAGPDGRDHLGESMDRLSDRGAGAAASDWTVTDCRDSIAALKLFQKSHGDLVQRQTTFRAVTGALPLLTVGKVGLSVGLDATAHRRGQNGADHVGGVLLAFSQKLAVDPEAQERTTVCALLCLMFAEQHLKHAGTADPKLCFTLDVFGQKLIHAPTGRTKRTAALQHSCEEIALRWPGITAPKDYDGPPWR